MKIVLGNRKFPDPAKPREVIWDGRSAMNPHWMICGMSGTGKTHTLRHRVIEAIQRQAPATRFHILDVHGDIDVPGASTVNFSETTAYGLNPLRISADHDFGGVRKRIRTFVSMLNGTASAKMGPKQEAVLCALLADLYEARGYLADDPRTWAESYDPRFKPRYPKANPTVTDLRKFADWKLKQMILGTGSKAVAALESLNREVAKLNRRHEASLKAGGENVDLGEQKRKCKEAFAEYVDHIETGREIEDIIKYDSRDVMKSVVDRIANLDSTGIFKPTPPPFDPKASLRRYNIKALSADEQRMFVTMVLEDLFLEAKQRGEQAFPTDFAVLDEGHKFISDDDGHIINVVAKEARKFGLGLIIASQSLTHFSEDFLANTATKVILGLDEMYHIGSARMLQIEPKRFKFITPRKTALVQVKNQGDFSNAVVDVVLD